MFDNLLDLYKITKYEIDRFYCILTNLFYGFLVFNFLSISGSIFYFGLAQRGKIRQGSNIALNIFFISQQIRL